MNNIYDLFPRYCLACENKKVCWENNWVITMDKDGRKCDNFKVRKDIKELRSMNKKIKVIDLIEMFYRKEKMPKRIKVSCYEFEYDEEIDAYFNLDKNSNNNSLIQDWLNNANKLNNEVEILEDNTEEIEEKSNFEDMGYEIAQAYFEFYKGIAKALIEKRKEKSNDN